MRYTLRASHIVRATAMLLERAATVALAVQTLRLNQRMAAMGNVLFMKQEIQSETIFVIVTLIALVVAFIMSLVDEILWIVQSNQDEAKFKSSVAAAAAMVGSPFQNPAVLDAARHARY